MTTNRGFIASPRAKPGRAPGSKDRGREAKKMPRRSRSRKCLVKQEHQQGFRGGSAGGDWKAFDPRLAQATAVAAALAATFRIPKKNILTLCISKQKPRRVND